MHPAKSFFLIATLVAASLLPALVVHAGETATPPRPPTRIEPLRLPPEVERGVVRLRLLIDQAGHPQKIAVISLCDEVIASRLVPAVSKWQFTPASKNGQPVAAEVILPVNLVQLTQLPTGSL